MTRPLKRLVRVGLFLASSLLGTIAISARDLGWQPIPLRADTSVAGGEGCQIISQIAAGPGGNVLLMGTDVGGLYRSTNGGSTWIPSNNDYRPRGARSVAIDPANANCFYAVGSNGNSSYSDFHGLWRSTDQGISWSPVKTMPLSQEGVDGRGWAQVVFDPTSVSGGKTQRLYWITAADAPAAQKGIYRSDDGGTTWNLVNTNYTNAFIAVVPTNGWVIVGDTNGLYRSKDFGVTFATLNTTSTRAVAVSANQPNWVYITQATSATTSQLLLSTNAGDSFAARAGTGIPAAESFRSRWHLTRVVASPVNANYLFAEMDANDWFDWPRFSSTDGGNNWTRIWDADYSKSFIPHQWARRFAGAAWSPSDANTIWTAGGDWIAKSTDAATNFVWSNNGYNAIYMGGRNNFVPGASTILITSQDYNSASTTNGGSTWNYENPLNSGWGGYNYGGYMFDANNMFLGSSEFWGGPRTLYKRVNGGGWVSTGLIRYRGTDDGYVDFGCGDPKNPNVAFYGKYRTTDKGASWSTMTNCQNVITWNPQGNKELYGVRANSMIVRSNDSGATWQDVGWINTSWIEDLAFDWKNNRIYYTSDYREKFGYWDLNTSSDVGIWNLPQDWTIKGAYSVAVDPVNPDIVYVATFYGDGCSKASAARSLDKGATWENLQKQPGDTGLEGVREGVWVRVNPVTREVWFAGNCYGLWKFPAPDGTIVTPPISGGIPAGPNLVVNPGFESGGGQNPVGWATWAGTGGSDNDFAEGIRPRSGSLHGTHWNPNTAYQVLTSQIITGLTNGKYTLRAWVIGTGGQNVSVLFAKDFGSAERNVNIINPNYGYTQYTITDVEVTNGQVEIGFWSDAPANQFISFDDMEFFRQAIPDPYISWTALKLGALPLADQSPTADPYSDGMVNLLEYALGTEPRTPAAPPLQARVVNSRMQLSFMRAAADLNYEVLASSDLLAWAVISTNPGAVSQAAFVTVTDNLAQGPRPSRFLRLRVIKP